MHQLIPNATSPVPLFNNNWDGHTAPLATIQNIAHALDEIGRRMDHETDLLILAMTSHGSKQGFALRGSPAPSRILDPATLKAMLDRANIRNKVLIVSACYSGVFLPALEDDHTLVITAAAADRASFGCSDDRDLTYFGEAFFRTAMPKEKTFVQAFESARALIGSWESSQGLTPSLPQMSVGKEVQRLFPDIIGALPAGDSSSRAATDASLGLARREAN